VSSEKRKTPAVEQNSQFFIELPPSYVYSLRVHSPKSSQDFLQDQARQISRLQRILEASKLLNSTLSLAELTEIVLQIVKDELGVDRVTVFLVDSDQKMIRSLVAQGLEREIRLAIGTGVAGTVAATGTSLDIPDAYQDSRFDPAFDRALGYHTNDVFCCPIANSEGGIVGVLQLLNRTRPFTSEDEFFLSDMSGHIALAFERACFFDEIVNKRKLEQELLLVRDRLAQNEKMSLIGELISGVVHEVKNPLAALVGHCALLKEEAAPYEHLTKRIETLESSSKRALKVIQNFLGFARKQDGARVLANVNDLLRQTMELLSYEWKARGIAVDQRLFAAVPVLVEVGEIQQVFLNIFKNAQDAINQGKRGGILTVYSSHDLEKGSVLVAIGDNGPGISLQVTSKIFEPFVTTKPKGVGTGLGLSISRRIIEEHNGTIWFESNEQHGTIFYIQLPKAAD
jgi:signal transduction histidine kinase